METIQVSTDKENVVYTGMHTHTQDYYLVTKKKGSLPFATIWMNFEDIMLHEVNKTKQINTS